MSDGDRAPARLLLRIHRNHIYVDAASFDVHFAGSGHVALLRDRDDLLILPIAGAQSGGFYVKQVNARGDRAIHAADFFRLEGVDEIHELRVHAAWAEAIAGFSVRGFFAQATGASTK